MSVKNFGRSQFDYIRAYYGVPAKRGMRVRVNGQTGKILSARYGQLKVRFDIGNVAYCHPTWRIEYLTERGA